MNHFSQYSLYFKGVLTLVNVKYHVLNILCFAMIKKVLQDTVLGITDLETSNYVAQYYNCSFMMTFNLRYHL